MDYFVKKDSIVRKIWGKGDTILFIFAGASAEFALNRAVDWLYFTGKLPNDPLGRLFSTVTYARKIVFSEKEAAYRAIDNITAIHSAVEHNRNSKIPDWAYRDVLFMLIHYSIASYELLERKLSAVEKDEVFDVFHRFGERMNLIGLPGSYNEWVIMRKDHLDTNLIKSSYTVDLYKQYKKHLGAIRYQLLIDGQKLVVPKEVKALLKLSKISSLTLILPIYKLSGKAGIDAWLKNIILPKNYKKEIKDLDVPLIS